MAMALLESFDIGDGHRRKAPMALIAFVDTAIFVSFSPHCAHNPGKKLVACNNIMYNLFIIMSNARVV